MNRSTGGVMAALIVAVITAIGGYAWWQHQHPPQPAEAELASAAGTGAAAPVTPPLGAGAPGIPASQIDHPLDLPAGLPALPPADKADAYVESRLVDLLGKPAMLSMVNGERFIARFVATVDNLARDTASTKVWPVNPTPERFLVDEAGGVTVLSPRNAARYEPLVHLLETLDANSAVALYRHLYPLFQQAYEELGYPGRYFNDRLVTVIDNLLQAPEIDAPIPLSLTEVKGPIPSTRPWVRYQFADSNLEARSAGQKILMRMGPAQEKRVKARLAEFREQLVLGGRATR